VREDGKRGEGRRKDTGRREREREGEVKGKDEGAGKEE